MTAFMRAWADDPAVGAVLIDGAGERGLCAGGDLRALYDAAKSGDPLPERFWATEYQLERVDRALSEAGDRDHGRHGDGRRRRDFGPCRASRRDRALRRSPCRKSASDFFPTSARRSCWRARPGAAGTLSGADRRVASARPTRSIAGSPTSIFPRHGSTIFPRALADCRTARRGACAACRSSPPCRPRAIARQRDWIERLLRRGQR